MSKSRTFLKYAAVGVVTAQYLAALTYKLKGPPENPPAISKEKFAAVVGVSLALTWVATLA